MKNKIEVVSVFIAFLIVACLISQSFALEVRTHWEIDMRVTGTVTNGFSFDDYLKNGLAFEYGKDEPLSNFFSARDLLANGGIWEDMPPYGCVPYARSINHFHNPLNDNGYSGVVLGIGNGMSAVLWAQKSRGSQASFLCGDNFSWYDVRDYYFQALTSQDDTYRNGVLFANVFRGLGQLMHLVQDMSVPEHARDDTHVLTQVLPKRILTDYEAWVNDGIVRHDPNLASWINHPFPPDSSLTGTSSTFSTEAPLPIANLFDTNRYTATNPDPSVTLDNAVGLSEFTNANFFSADTIFGTNYPHPNWSDVEEYNEIVDNTTGRQLTYLRKMKIEGGQRVVHIPHLAVVKWLPKYLPANVKTQLCNIMLCTLQDDRVYSDYAKELLPRAAGYSAELMKYFFRGALEVSRPDENVYSVIDGSVSQSFRKIKARVRNNTPSEEAGSGTLYAIAKYKVRGDYLPDLSHDPPSQPPEVDYSYSISTPVTIDNSAEAFRLKADNPNSYLFDFSASPIPTGVTDLTLMVVFKGTLGYESDSAIAVGSNDLMEPAHHVYFNLTDMFAINGHLWTAQQIRDNTSLLSQVGTAHIDPFPMSVGVSYVNQAPPMPITTPEIDIAVADLSPGEHFELIVLVDNNNYIRVTEADSIDPGFDTRYTGYIGFRNQSYGGAWTSTPDQLLLFRHDAVGNSVRSNFQTGWLRCTPYDGGYCPYPENEATVPLPGISPVPVQILGDFGL